MDKYKRRIIRNINDDSVVLIKLCSITNKEYVVKTTTECMFNYHNGSLLQDAFPDLDADQRDFIKFGLTPHEYNDKFCSDYSFEDPEEPQNF